VCAARAFYRQRTSGGHHGRARSGAWRPVAHPDAAPLRVPAKGKEAAKTSPAGPAMRSSPSYRAPQSTSTGPVPWRAPD